jgi:hypothetical protein
MDFISAVRSDGIQPLFTYVVPGGFATAPYFLLTISYMPQVELFWDRHPAAFTIVITFVVLFTGAFLEELGTRLELIWDRRLAHRNPSNWEPYLQLKVKDEIVGQRYLRNVLMRMKFQLSMMLALPILTVGLVWLNVRLRFGSGLHWSWSRPAWPRSRLIFRGSRIKVPVFCIRHGNS